MEGPHVPLTQRCGMPVITQWTVQLSLVQRIYSVTTDKYSGIVAVQLSFC